MIKKLYSVFSLQDSVCGISNNGIEYDEYSYVLDKAHRGTFNTIEECESYIDAKMKDYRKRKAGQNTRFVILPIFCFDDDSIFNAE